MAFKTTIGPKGVVTENIPGTQDVVVVSTQQRKTVTTVDVSGSARADTAPFMLYQPSAAGVTASLPGISAAILGTEVWVMKASGSASTLPLLVSASNKIDGGPWTLVTSASCAAIHLLATSSSLGVGFNWHILSTKGNFT
jgi:hypothetical protein